MSQYSFGDYLKEAFGWRWRVPLLGKMPINAVGIGAFAVAGIANPGFWLLGVALEVAYVMGLASSDRFQKLVQAQRLMAQKETVEQKMAKAFNRLSTHLEDPLPAGLRSGQPRPRHHRGDAGRRPHQHARPALRRPQPAARRFSCAC